MKLPDKLCRRAVKEQFNKLSKETWDYLFDHDKENGLFECRTRGWGARKVWYATKPLMLWLVDRGYYMPDDFEERSKPRRLGPWQALLT